MAKDYLLIIAKLVDMVDQINRAGGDVTFRRDRGGTVIEYPGKNRQHFWIALADEELDEKFPTVKEVLTELFVEAKKQRRER